MVHWVADCLSHIASHPSIHICRHTNPHTFMQNHWRYFGHIVKTANPSVAPSSDEQHTCEPIPCSAMLASSVHHTSSRLQVTHQYNHRDCCSILSWKLHCPWTAPWGMNVSVNIALLWGWSVVLCQTRHLLMMQRLARAACEVDCPQAECPQRGCDSCHPVLDRLTGGSRTRLSVRQKQEIAHHSIGLLFVLCTPSLNSHLLKHLGATRKRIGNLFLGVRSVSS